MEKNKKELGAEFKYTTKKEEQVKSKEELDSAFVYSPKKGENATQKKQTTASKSTKKTEKKNNKKTAAANPFTYSKKTDKKNDKKKNISDDEVLLLGQGPLSDRAAERVSQGVLQKRDEKRQLKKTRAENKKLLESGTKREEELYRAAEAVWNWRQSFGVEYGIKYAEGKKYKDFLEGRTKLSDWEQSKYKPSYEWFEQNVGYAQHDADEKHIEKYQRMVKENDRRRRIEADMQKKLSGTNVKLDEDGNVNWTAGREEAKYLKERAEKGQILGSLSIEDRQRAAEENADESVKRRAEAFYALGDEAAKAESKLKAYNEYGKRINNKYDNNLLGRIAGNYRAGRIGIQANDAGYTAYKLKTDDLEAVEVYQHLGEAIQKNNYNTFKNKNGFEEFVAQNAQYAPQAVDQLKASVPGRVIQLAGAKGLGSAVANAAEAEYMFRQTAGASFITNIQERGLSIEDARALAQNEAVLSGAIEFGMGFAYDKVGDYVSDKVGAGVQKRFFKLLTNKGISERGAKIIINSAKSAGGFVYDNIGEAMEEWLQEGVSVNAGKMSEKGNIPSIAQLTAKSLDASGYSNEDLEQMNEAAKGSWLIGLGRAGMSAAGRIGRSGINSIGQNKNNILKNFADEEALRTALQSYSENDSAESVKYYISPEFTASYDSWVTAGRPDRKTLTVGRTSEALRSIGVKEQSITWDTSKINKSLKKHTYLNDGIMKQIPNVLENPIIIMQSTQRDSRVTMFGEVYDGDGLPVMAVLELSPLKDKGGVVLEEIKLASTYSKKKLNNPTSINPTQNLISNSEILYVDPDKKRTDNWLARTRLQLPFVANRYGSLKSITYSEGNVKQKSGNNSKNQFLITKIKGEKGDYGVGVYLDTDLFSGLKPRNWSKALQKFVYDNLSGKILRVYDKNGKPETIQFAKKNERVLKDGANNSHKVIDKLARTNGNIPILSVVHIDELLNTSEVTGENKDNTHQWLDENGWEYRKTYVQSVYGMIYEATLNIARARDGRKILYNISNIKEVDGGVVPSHRMNTNRGSLATSTSADSITQDGEYVKQNFSEIIKNTERIFGVKVQLEEKLPNGADGYCGNGVIHLSKNSRQALDFVLTHEIVHHLQAVNNADYNVYKMLALRYTAENGNITAEELIKQKQEQYGAVGLTQTEAIDEIAADFAADMLRGEKLSELFERIDNGELIHDAKRGKSVIMRFVNSVKALIRRIKQRASGKGYLKRAAELEEVISAFEKTAAGAKDEFNTLRENSENKFLISDENSRLDSEEEELWQNEPEDEEFWTDNPEELKDIIRKLRIRSEYLKGKKLRPYVVLEFARELKRAYGSKVSARELSVDLMKLYNDMAQMQTKGHIDDVEILNRTGKIASEILLGAEVRMDISPEVKAMRDHIRASRISISEKDKLDFGGKKEWNEFRKSNFGRMKITNDGLPVDTFYEELCEFYPEYFNKDEYTHPADRMKNIAKVLRDTDGTVIKLDENMDFKSAETFLVYDILEKFSSADADERSVISEIEKIDKTAKTEYEEKRREEMTELRKKFDEKYRQSKERRNRFEKEAQEKISKIRSERRAAEDKKKLLNLLKFFDRIRTTPERLEDIKKSMNSEELESFKDAEKFAGKTPEEIVRMLDTQGIRLLEEGYERTDGVKVMGRLELSELENAYMRAKEEDVPRFEAESGGKGDFIPNRLLEQKFKRLHNIQIDTLTYGQVRELIELLAAVKNQIENENKLLAAEEEKRADEITKKIHKELRSGKDFMKKSMGFVSKLSDKGVLKKWKLDQLNANTVFKKLAGYLPDSEFNSLAEELREGQRRKTSFERTVQRHFEGFFGKNLEKGMQKERQKLLDGEWVSIGNGRKITKGMRIALYLHSKNYSNLESIRDFGITIPDKKLYKKHKKDAYNQGETIKLSPSEIREIVSNMSEAEREFADKYAYPFFNDITTKHINEVSRKLVGYDIAVVKDYFPKNTDMNMVESEAVGAYDILSTAENQGFMKHRTRGKALLLVDVFDAVDKTAAGVAKYYGMALAMRDLRKILGKSDGGGKTTLGLIAELHGEDMKRWIEDLLRDYENPRIDTKLAKERARGLGSSFASSVLTGRVTTLLKQGGALFVGIPEVGIENWTGSFGRHVYKKDIELWQDASTAFWQRGTDYRKIDPRSWIENTDKFYVQRLCSAVMHGIEKDFKIDRNVRSDEYWEALRQPEVMAEIGKRIDDMINNTQSVYTTMERPTILRKNTAFLKHLLPFKTQNFQDFNLLSQNIQEYRAMIKYAKEGVASKQECTAALQKCADTVLGLTLNYMFVTAMSLAGSVVLGTAERYEEDGDDEEEENKMFEELSPFWRGVNNIFNKDGKGVITPESVSSKMLSDFVNNFAGDFMFCDELAEWVQSAVTGKKYYGMEIGTLEMVNDALEQTGRTLNNLRLIGTDEFSKKQLMTNLKDAVILAGSLFGIPGENTENIINALLFHFSNSVEQANNEWEASIYINPYKIKYDMFKGSTNIKTDEEWYIEQFYDMARFAVNIKKTENRRKAYDDLNTMFWETSEKFKDEEEKERFQEKLYKQLDRLGSRNSNVVKRVLADKESWIERSQVDYSAVDEEIKRLKQRGADIDFKTDKRAVLKYEITDEEGNETEKKVVLTPAEAIRYQEDVKQMIYEAFYDAMRDTTWSIRNDTEREIIFNDYKKEAIDQVKRQYIKNKTGDMTAATPFEKFVEEREFRKDAQSFNKIRGNKYVTLDGNTSVYYELAEALASEYDSAYERNLKEIGEALFTEGADISEFIGGNYKKVLYCSEMTDKQREATERAIKSTATKNKLTEAEKAKLLSDFKNNITPYEKNVQWEGSVDSLTVSEKDKLYEKIKKATKERTEEVLGSRIKNEARVVYNKNSDGTWSANVNETDNKNLTEEKNKTESVNVSFNVPASSNKKASYKKRSYKASNKSRSNKTSNTVVVSNIPKKNNFPVKTENGTKAVRVGTDFYDRNKINTDEIGKKYKRIAKAPTEVLNYDDWRTVMNTWMRCLSEWRFTDDDRKILQMEDSGINAVFYEPESVAAAFWEWIRYGENAGFDTSEYLNGEE